MQNEPLRILAVNPGSRYMGFAAFRGSELLDWGVRVNSAETPRGMVRVAGQIVKQAIGRFRPDVLAMKRVHSSRTSPDLDRLTESVLTLSRLRKVQVRRYSIADLKAALASETRGSRRRLADAVTAVYPVLANDLLREAANRNPYYFRMFEAVALGIACYRQSGE